MLRMNKIITLLAAFALTLCTHLGHTSYYGSAFDYRKFSITINVPSRELKVSYMGQPLKTYPVGVGLSKSRMTPPGGYYVDEKVIDPIWEHPFRPDGHTQIQNLERNPLGRYWIGFHNHGNTVYGIHGTNQPSTVGRFVSHGCVRMHNADIKELFGMVEVDTPVTVTYKRYELQADRQRIYLKTYPDPYKYGPIDTKQVVAEIEALLPHIPKRIDYDLLQKATNDTTDGSLYEIAVLGGGASAYPVAAPQPAYYRSGI